MPSDDTTVGDIDLRRRRALFRAMHRGTKEMDLMLGGYVAAHVGGLDAAALDVLDQLLALPDPDLSQLLLAASLANGEGGAGPLIAEIRHFHGLDD